VTCAPNGNGAFSRYETVAGDHFSGGRSGTSYYSLLLNFENGTTDISRMDGSHIKGNSMASCHAGLAVMDHPSAISAVGVKLCRFVYWEVFIRNWLYFYTVKCFVSRVPAHVLLLHNRVWVHGMYKTTRLIYALF
jgi:hypothetical protein